MEQAPTIIALTGKGGVGKTSLAALFVRHLCEAYPDKRILAIDADPAIGLSTALGVEVGSTVDDIRKLFIEHAEDGDAKAAMQILSEAKYQISDALVEKENLSFLAIGRPEAAGCYCKVNAYLKEVIGLLSSHFDYVVIDGEAGIEQVNRRVMEKVTHLVLVSDASKKGLKVTQTIYQVAKELTMFQYAGIIVNRLTDRAYLNRLDLGGIPLLAAIEDDKAMTESDIDGDSVFELPETSPIYQGSKKALMEMGLLANMQSRRGQ